MDEGYVPADQIVQELFRKNAFDIYTVLQLTCCLHILWIDFQLIFFKIGGTWKVLKILFPKKYSPTAKAFLQASYPNIELGTSTMDEYFNQSNESIWGKLQAGNTIVT